MKYKDFLSLWLSAEEDTDLNTFIAEEGCPPCLGDNAAEIMTAIHTVANSDNPIKALSEYAYSVSAISRDYCIPLRTLQGWCGKERSCPDYATKLLAYAVLNK